MGLPNNLHGLNASYLLSLHDKVWVVVSGSVAAAWRAPHPPARGNLWLCTKPLVHVGFLKSWVAGGLNQRVVGRVSELVRAPSAGGTTFRIYVTGGCWAAWSGSADKADTVTGCFGGPGGYQIYMRALDRAAGAAATILRVHVTGMHRAALGCSTDWRPWGLRRGGEGMYSVARAAAGWRR